MSRADRTFSGLTDAQPLVPDADYVRKGAQFFSLTGIAITRMGNGDWFYTVDTTAASRTVTLPDVADEVGHHHVIKRITGGTNECNIITAAGNLDGSATHSIAAQYGVRAYFSDGDGYRSLAPNATAGTGEVTSGTYTPTLTNVANLDGSTAQVCQYLRVGNVVTVSGRVDVDPTAAAIGTQLGISLPIASAFASTIQLGGTGASGAANEIGHVQADATNDRAELTFIAQSTANHSIWFSFTYLIL